MIIRASDCYICDFASAVIPVLRMSLLRKGNCMKRKMKFFAALLACAMLTSPIAAIAGQWVPMGQDWAYMTDDGTFAKNTWLWLDENHDQNAELYHFDANGMMSKQTTISSTGFGYTLSINVDQNGVANYYAQSDGPSGVITPVTMPPYAIHMVNGSYGYFLPDGVPYYNFAELRQAFFSDLTDYGSYYAANAYLPVYFTGSNPELWIPMECSIPTSIRFTKNCLVTVNGFDASGNFIDDVLPISDYIARNIDCNLVVVHETDANGYISSCSAFVGD